MEESSVPPGGSRRRLNGYLFFFVVFAGLAFLLHFPLLDLPFFWDEVGQFVPAALDLYNEGAWVPRSVLPNVHPPGVMAYLAAVWSLTGFSVEATRAAMLLLAGGGVFFSFLLALRLCGGTRGFPALPAAGFLLVSPLFFTQSMMAQLDMPAMVFTVISLWLALSGRWRLAACACVPLVLLKETSLIVPAVLGGWLVKQGRAREATWFLLPGLALGAWLLVLYQATGSPFGNREFAQYNLTFALHPARILIALFRRLHYLAVADFHWLGAVAITLAARKSDLFRSPAWRLCAWMAASHVALFSMVGGAALERYLLPVLPLLYIAIAASFTCFSRRWQLTGQALLILGLATSNFIHPPYPFPLENNLAMVDMVRVQQEAAAYLELRAPKSRIATAWPLSAALRRPEFGYVEEPLTVENLADFTPSALKRLRQPPEVFVLYSREWRPRWNLLEWRPLRALRQRFYQYEPPSSAADVQQQLGLYPVWRLARNGQWVEIFVRPPPGGP